MFQRDDIVIDSEDNELARVLKVMPDGERYFIITIDTGMYRIVEEGRLEEDNG